MISIRKELLHLESLLAVLTSQPTLKQDTQSLVRLVRKNLLSLAEEILCLEHNHTNNSGGGNSGQGGECAVVLNTHTPTQEELVKYFPEFFAPLLSFDVESREHGEAPRFYDSFPTNAHYVTSEVDCVQLQ